MSGGIAYVHDPEGDFHIRCNKEMVDLEPLDDAEDIDLVHGLLERHRQYTGSTVADGLLKQWPKITAKFVKIMPRDYKRVLLEQLAASSEVHAAAAKPNGKKANGKKASGKTAGAGAKARG
jgi:glutamate synthase domain-containing protein 3